MTMKYFMLISLLATALNAFAAGPSVGGGGDVIILPDDSVVLADPWIDGGAPQPNNMPPLRALNPRILQSINAYAKATQSLLLSLGNKGKSEIFDLLSVLATRKNNLRFYGVQSAEELNNFCAPGGRKIYKLPDGASVQQVACTAGEETFVVEPLFLRLSLRDQALLLIHERLTTLRDQYGGKNYSAIARFTTGLSVYLNLYSEQSLKKYRQLTTDEQKLLSEFYIAIEEVERRNEEIGDDSFQWRAHAFGGGLVHLNSQVDPTALITLNSYIPRNSIVEEGVKIFNLKSDPKIALELGKNTQIKDTIFDRINWTSRSTALPADTGAFFKTGENVVITNSTIANLRTSFVIENNAKIEKTLLAGRDLVIGENSYLTDSKVVVKSLTIGSYVKLRSSQISLIFLDRNNQLGQVANVTKIANDQELNSVSISNDVYTNYFPLGTKLKTIDYSVNVTGISCSYPEKKPKDNPVKGSFLNEFNEGITVTGKMVYDSKTGVFNPTYYYKGDIQASVKISTFKKVNDPSVVMINKDGLFVRPEYSRAEFSYDLSSMESCIARQVVQALDKGITTPTRTGGNTIFIAPAEI